MVLFLDGVGCFRGSLGVERAVFLWLGIVQDKKMVKEEEIKGREAKTKRANEKYREMWLVLSRGCARLDIWNEREGEGKERQ